MITDLSLPTASLLSPDQVQVIPVTLGSAPIRQALHAETSGKDMEVPEYFYNYIDILAEFNAQFDSNFTSVAHLAQS